MNFDQIKQFITTDLQMSHIPAVHEVHDISSTRLKTPKQGSNLIRTVTTYQLCD